MVWKCTKLYFCPKYHQSRISIETAHIFFILWPGFHWLFGHFWWYSRIFLATKFENHRWYSWNSEKKNWNFSVGRLGPRASAPALGPSRPPEKFQFIFLPSFMKPPMVSNFVAKKYSWNHQKWPNNQWNQVTKKNARFPFKTLIILVLSYFCPYDFFIICFFIIFWKC